MSKIDYSFCFIGVIVGCCEKYYKRGSIKCVGLEV